MSKRCIHVISSRRKCLPHCMRTLYDHYNKNHNYKVFVHYFDDIYNDQGFRDELNDNCGGLIEFISIPYKTPSHIHERDLYYNRPNIKYVANSFSINRKGYLHMCHFMSNFYGYSGTKFNEYDMAMSLDDESTFTKDMDHDPFDIVQNNRIDIGALIFRRRLKNGRPHQGHLDTRIKLWEFTKNFVEYNNVEVASPALRTALKHDSEKLLHYLPWADSYVVNLKVFKTDLWKKWARAFNDYGGIYKYRWGDNELNTLFALMIQEDGVLDTDTVRKGFHNQGGSRHLQDLAPNIKNLDA